MSSFPTQLATAIRALAAISVVLGFPAMAGAEPQGVWEPVNYSEDLTLTDVFFVTPDVGYVSGVAGTILKTVDGGASWTPQLGGDPNSGERPIQQLWFVTENAGWAVLLTRTDATLLRTQDGENWEPIGTIPEHYEDMSFTSEQDGVVTHNEKIFRTHDGGRTWDRVSDCSVRAEVNGLTRQVKCQISRMHFPTPTVGYAVAAGEGAAWVLRTDDGGTTWQGVTPIVGEYGRSSGIFFIDEYTGYVRLHSGKSWRTDDGGQTWTRMLTDSLGERIRFADPGIGWSLANGCVARGCGKLTHSYTTDGGRRWFSRSMTLPADVTAFSFPRRDIAYAVGEHGMIYRYRVLWDGEPVGPGAIVSVPMPSLDAEVYEQLAQAETQLAEFDAAIEQAELSGADFFAQDDASLSMQSGGTGVEWLPATFPDEFAPLQASMDVLAAELPEIGSKHRNLNLVLVGLKLLSDLTGRGEGLEQSFASLRDAKDLGSVSAALIELHAQLDSVKTTVEEFRMAEGEF